MPELTNTINVEGIGPVHVTKSKRAKYLRIRVDPKMGVTVIKPLFMSDKHVIRFINEKLVWIQRAQQRQERVKSNVTVFAEDKPFKTRHHTLHLCRHNKQTVKSVVTQGKIAVWFPHYAEVEDACVQSIIRRAILEAWRVEAKKILPPRVDQLARKHGFKYNKLTFKNAKTRWGSCSGKNNINLNLQLMRLPDSLIDYVILHELNHTIHKHHQKTFWANLEQILPNARKLDKELNNYHLEYW